MARIEAPNPEFEGKIGTVRFIDGVAETEDLAVIGYCQGAGYKVSGVQRNPLSMPPNTPPADPRFVQPELVGGALRDAAVNPKPGDVPPVNAGLANPHGPEVVAVGNAGVIVAPEPVAPEYNPTDHTAADVLAYLETASKDEALRVLDLEAGDGGKQRSTVLAAREGVEARES